jgi:hypothetical protein
MIRSGPRKRGSTYEFGLICCRECPVYIRKTRKTHKGKAYTNYLLVESVHTPKGPRQRIIGSLGSLAPAPREQWRDLAHRLQASLEGQSSLPPADPQVEALAEQVRRGPKARPVREGGRSARSRLRARRP